MNTDDLHDRFTFWLQDKNGEQRLYTRKYFYGFDGAVPRVIARYSEDPDDSLVKEQVKKFVEKESGKGKYVDYDLNFENITESKSRKRVKESADLDCCAICRGRINYDDPDSYTYPESGRYADELVHTRCLKRARRGF